MTSRMHELIRQLGEAIHDAVTENEPISNVVQQIRLQGFEVVLMLEATIALDEAQSGEASDQETAEARVHAQTAHAPFTTNDLSFLKSLRIAVEGEKHETADSEHE